MYVKSCRFSELSWFWDPNSEWLLPAKCPECSQVIPADTVENSKETLQSSNCQIPCPECHHMFWHIPRYARGDPRTLPSLATGMAGSSLDLLASIVVVSKHVTCTVHMHAWIINEFVLLKSLLPQ